MTLNRMKVLDLPPNPQDTLHAYIGLGKGVHPMLGQRYNDPTPRTHYRSDRVSAINGQYFFSTREGTLEGPYFSRTEAERQIGFYIDRIHKAAEMIKYSPR